MLTRPGRATAAACYGALAAFALTGYPQLAAAAAACAAALVAAVVAAPRPRLELTASWDRERAVEGETAVLTVTAVNLSGRAVPPLRVTTGDGLTVRLPRITRRSTGSAATTTPALARGLRRPGPLLAEPTDPLGLVHRRSGATSAAQLVVHPLFAEPGPADLRPGDDDAGRTSGRGRREGAAAFHALRRYELGDDLRHVHWLSTARTGTPMVRDMVVPSPRRQVVVLDTSQDAYPDPAAFEVAVRVCASIAVAALRTQELVLVAGDAGTARHRSRAAREAVLDLLAGVEAVAAAPPGRLPRRTAGSSVVTVVTGPVPDPGHWPRQLGTRDLTLVEVTQEARRRPGAHGRRRVPVASLDDFEQRWAAAWSD